MADDPWVPVGDDSDEGVGVGVGVEMEKVDRWSIDEQVAVKEEEVIDVALVDMS